MTGIIKEFNGIRPRIHPKAFVAETAVIIGDVEIGAGSSIWYGCVIRADVNRIVIGKNTNIQDGTVIHCNHDPKGPYRETGGGMPTIIGDNITVGHMALLHACTLEDDSFVGMKALVMDQAVVESTGMLAAGALLSPRKRLPSGTLWAGNPARHVRELTEKEISYFSYSADNYQRLSQQHALADSRPDLQQRREARQDP
ncbi:gamma carbonic anhydrase family protein [Rhodovibrionaceae bacterium A322]